MLRNIFFVLALIVSHFGLIGGPKNRGDKIFFPQTFFLVLLNLLMKLEKRKESKPLLINFFYQLKIVRKLPKKLELKRDKC